MVWSCGSGSKEEPNGKDTTSVNVDTPPLDLTDTGTATGDGDTAGTQEVPKDFKIGHLYSEAILIAMPERLAIEKQLSDLTKQLENEVQNKYKEYQTKYERVLTDTTLSEAAQEALVNQLSQLEVSIQKLQVESQQVILAKREELYIPLYDKINKAIARVAKARGYTYIIDGSQGTLVYGLDSYDITPLVKRELGLK